jgi:hypothetical protein
VLVVPTARRPQAAAAGGAFVVGVVYSLLLLGWHYPSDVLGGFCIASAWMALAVAGLVVLEEAQPRRSRPAPRRSPPPVGTIVAPAAWTAVVAAAVAVGVAAARPMDALNYIEAHTAFVGGAAAIGAWALALAAAAAASITRRR